MSMIGGTTVAGLNLAGSIVGSSRPEAVSDQGKASSANQRAQIELNAAAGESPDDIADAEFSTDRDADGRQMYQRRTQEPPALIETAADDAAVAPAVTSGHAADAFGDRGKALDIDA
jgi:hypothetical protein